MKTDLAKILSVSGHHGLFLFLAQSRTGAIAEALSDKKRTAFDAHSRISTLSDIAIFTSEGEMRLAEVFTAMKKAADEGASVPSPKADAAAIRNICSRLCRQMISVLCRIHRSTTCFIIPAALSGMPRKNLSRPSLTGSGQRAGGMSRIL